MQAVKAAHVPVLLLVMLLCAGMMVSSWPPEVFQFDPLARSMYILVFSCFSIVQFFWAVTAPSVSVSVSGCLFSLLHYLIHTQLKPMKSLWHTVDTIHIIGQLVLCFAGTLVIAFV